MECTLQYEVINLRCVTPKSQGRCSVPGRFGWKFLGLNREGLTSGWTHPPTRLDEQFSARFMIFKPSARWILKTGPTTSYQMSEAGTSWIQMKEKMRRGSQKTLTCWTSENMPQTGSAFTLHVKLNFIARYLTRVLQGMLTFYGSMNICFKSDYSYSSSYNLKIFTRCVVFAGIKVEELTWIVIPRYKIIILYSLS